MENKTKYIVEGMTCASCVSHVQNKVSKVKGVTDVTVNLMTKVMIVTGDVDYKDVKEAVSNAGYSLNEKEVSNSKSDGRLNRLIASIVISVILMYVSMGDMLHLPLPSFLKGVENAITLISIEIVLALSVIIINFKIYISGYKKLFRLNPNMDSLISIGSSFSFLYGVFSFIMIIVNYSNSEIVTKYYSNLYFDSSAVILTLVSLGKYLENRSTKKTRMAITKLVKLVPQSALLEKDGQTVETEITSIKIGEVVVVKKGMQIPVDGVIIEGSASIDEANITGESVPVYKSVNDSVSSSTIITNGFIKVRVQKEYEDTTISKIIRLVDEASNSKAPISKFVDKVAGVFSFVVMGISLVCFLIYLLLGYDIEYTFNIAISILVISCPCALGLATPVAIMVGTGVAAKNGFLIKDATILEQANKINKIIFDKTGTLTYGHPEVIDIIDLNNDFSCLQIAYSLENLSNHPFSEAIIKEAKNKNTSLLNVSDFETIDGVGIKGVIDGNLYYAGNMLGLSQENLLTDELKKRITLLYEEGCNVICVYKNDLVIGLISIKDKLKKRAIELIENLKKIKIEPIMVTGDRKEIAFAISKELGINRVYCEVLPIEKADILDKIKGNNDVVGFVGDGVNDALALTKADIAIAMGKGTDIAIDSSDIVMLNDDMLTIYNAIILSKIVMRSIKVNLFWAFFYNCIGIVLATGVFSSLGIVLNPMISALAMSFSSLFVVSNALLINRYKPNKENKIKEEKKGINEMEKVLQIPNMACSHCQKRIEDALKAVNGLKDVKVTLEKKSVSFKYDNEEAYKNAVKAILQAGYDVL